MTNQNWSRRALLSTLAITTLGGCVGGSVGTTDNGDENSTNDDKQGLSTFWEYELHGRAGTPVVDDETVFIAGTIYDDDSAGTVFGLDRTNGQRKWHVDGLDGGIPFGPYLSNSTLVVVSDAGTVFGIDVDDHQRSWSTEVSGKPTTRPFAGEDSLYVGYDDGLRRIDVKTGAVEMAFEAKQGVDFAASADRTYVGSRRPNKGKAVVQAITGGATWTRRFDTTNLEGIAPTFDRVFVTVGRKLVALSPDSGETLWSTEVGQTVGEPVVSDESVHVATDEGVGAYLRENGKERWTASIDGGATTSPAVSKQYLFVGAGGEMRAFGADSGRVVEASHFKDGHLTAPPTTTGHRVFVGNFEERSNGYDGRIYSFDVAPK